MATIAQAESMTLWRSEPTSAAYAALIRFNGEPSIADLMSTFARVIEAGSRSELLAICGGLPDLGLPLY